MKSFFFSLASSHTFKRWTRKSYAVFNSLGKTIRIGVLITPLTLLFGVSEMKGQDPTNGKGESKEVDIDEIEIISESAALVFPEPSRVLTVIDQRELKQLPVNDLQSILEYAAGIDMRSRGPGVQADLSMRGGSFEQNLILIDGINWNDPQTGHFALNIPIRPNEIERIEVLAGGASRFYGAGAFTGAINIVTKKSGTNQAITEASYGQHGLYEAGVSLHRNLAGGYHKAAVYTSGSEGYRANTDFNRREYFYQTNYRFQHWTLNGLVSHQDRAFGANQFYSAVFPNQFETTSTGAAVVELARYGATNHRISAYRRVHYDEFQLRRDNPDFYRNFHRNQVYGVKYKSTFSFGGGSTQVAAEFRNESILSNNLGETITDSIAVREGYYYNKAASRSHFSLLADQTYKTGRWNLSFGSMIHYLAESNGWQFYPGIDLAFELHSHFIGFASWNRSMRLPSFTELYYQAPDLVGNPNLLPEEAQNFELGIRFRKNNLSSEAILFHRRGKNLIDWLWVGEEEKWFTQNLSKIHTSGTEYRINWSVKRLPAIQEVQIHYVYLLANKDNNEQETRYVLDYLRHNLSIKLRGTLIGQLRWSIQSQWQQRNGSYLKYEPESGQFESVAYPMVFLTDLRLSYNIESIKLNLFIDLKNSGDYRYVDWGNIEQPGRWVSGGIRWLLTDK